jgi:hypothetical protein
MLIEKFAVKGCCGKTSFLFKIDYTISDSLLNILKNSGYMESPVLTKSGILYVDNSEVILTGAFGSNTLQVKCKKINCEEIVSKLEIFLQNI